MTKERGKNESVEKKASALTAKTMASVVVIVAGLMATAAFTPIFSSPPSRSEFNTHVQKFESYKESNDKDMLYIRSRLDSIYNLMVERK